MQGSCLADVLKHLSVRSALLFDLGDPVRQLQLRRRADGALQDRDRRVEVVEPGQTGRLAADGADVAGINLRTQRLSALRTGVAALPCDPCLRQHGRKHTKPAGPTWLRHRRRFCSAS